MKKRALGMVYGGKGSNINIPCLDFDSVELKKVEKEVGRLQKKFQLGDASIYKSSENSYHVFFWGNPEKSWEKVLEIIKKAKFVDPDFKEHKEKTGSGRMRVFGKHKENIKFIEDIESDFKTQEDYKKFFKRFHNSVTGLDAKMS